MRSIEQLFILQARIRGMDEELDEVRREHPCVDISVRQRFSDDDGYKLSVTSISEGLRESTTGETLLESDIAGKARGLIQEIGPKVRIAAWKRNPWRQM